MMTVFQGVLKSTNVPGMKTLPVLKDVTLAAKNGQGGVPIPKSHNLELEPGTQDNGINNGIDGFLRL